MNVNNQWIVVTLIILIIIILILLAVIKHANDKITELKIRIPMIQAGANLWLEKCKHLEIEKHSIVESNIMTEESLKYYQRDLTKVRMLTARLWTTLLKCSMDTGEITEQEIQLHGVSTDAPTDEEQLSIDIDSLMEEFGLPDEVVPIGEDSFETKEIK